MNKKRWPQADHYQEKLGVLTNINYSFTKAFFKFPISSFLWNLDGFFFFFGFVFCIPVLKYKVGPLSLSWFA